MTTTSFHKSNLGSFGTDLPCDLNGYVHTTAAAWLDAPMDISDSDRADADYMAEWAAEMAAQTIAAVAESEKALADWQEKN